MSKFEGINDALIEIYFLACFNKTIWTQELEGASKSARIEFSRKKGDEIREEN